MGMLRQLSIPQPVRQRSGEAGNLLEIFFLTLKQFFRFTSVPILDWGTGIVTVKWTGRTPPAA
jgi:hypothetical protein